jgi:hypothetical protein
MNIGCAWVWLTPCHVQQGSISRVITEFKLVIIIDEPFIAMLYSYHTAY